METLEVVIATRNSGKLREIRQILAPLGLKVLSLEDFPEIPDILEDGRTFGENAVKKAAAVARGTGRTSIADDSGLAVDSLGGSPGVFSSRYAGEGATDADRYNKLLREMAGVPAGRRGAAFVCALAVVSPEGRAEVVEGECRGEIAFSPRGPHGFGYDPVFLIPALAKTMAELEPEAKNRISHRARALEKLKQVLPTFLKRD